MSLNTLRPPTLGSVIEQLPAAVALLDADRRLHCVNQRLARLLQRDAVSVEGHEWARYVHPIDRGLDQGMFAELCAGIRRDYRIEQRLRRADGSDLWARLAFSLADPQESTRPLVLVLVEDISELRRLHFDVSERRKELAILHAVSRQLIDTTASRSREWLQEVINLIPAAFQWPNYTEAAAHIGSLTAATARHAAHDLRSTPRIRTEWVNAAGDRCFLEALYAGPDTGHPAFLDEEYPLMESLADLLRAAATAAEQAAERERVQQELTASEVHLEMALEAARMGIMDWDIVGDACRLSDTACAMFGLPMSQNAYPSAEVQARVHPEDRESLGMFLKRERLTGATRHHEYRLLLPDGTVRWLSTRGRIFCDADGEAVRRLSVIVDITERKSLEDQYRQSQKMEALGRLAGGIAHDFNNLLTVVGATGELVHDELSAAHPCAADLTEILAAVERGRALTRQLLTFSRRDVVRRARVDMGRVLLDAESMLRRVLTGSIAMHVTSASTPLIVSADPNQLEQILLNLVVNARDALADGGQIDIHVSDCTVDDVAAELRPGLHPGRYAHLTVSDNGIGMDAATQSRIFEPFFTTKDAQRGTGLGLSTVFGIVRQYDGHVRVYSEPGQGATFRVYLPLVDSHDVDAWQPDVTPTHVPRGTETILVVDDEPQLRQVAKRILTELGYTVLVADAGNSALALSHAYGANIDLLLCDIALPGHDGREVSEALALTRPGMPTLFMSGYAADAAGSRLYLAPDAPFLEKPFTRQSLAVAVRRALGAKSD